MASNAVKCSYPYLQVLLENHRNSYLRKQLLANSKVLTCLSELTFNLLMGNVRLTAGEKKKLKKIKKDLEKLVQRGQTEQKYKLLTGQKGSGILSTLLTIGIPVIASLIHGANRK